MHTITRRFLLFATAFSSTAAPPAASPAFEFMSVHGTTESVAKYKGKAVALYLFNPG